MNAFWFSEWITREKTDSLSSQRGRGQQKHMQDGVIHSFPYRQSLKRKDNTYFK